MPSVEGGESEFWFRGRGRRLTGECEVAGWLRFFVAREVKRRSSG
jgi:hypothetical protein